MGEIDTTGTHEQLTNEDEKAAHPLELFFDLVFVFAITQVVFLIAHDLTTKGVLHGALLLGLLWWGWGTWTWALNAVDIEPRLVRVAVLVAMFGVFFMAFTVPTAFDGNGGWFAGGYVIVRLVSGAVMFHGTRDDPIEQEAIKGYLPISFIAPVLVVIGAAVGGDALQWLWLGALLVEIVAALVAGGYEWHLDAGHFAERHGLIMIIALGEAIIAVGKALTVDGDEVTAPPAIALIVGLFAACAMWWAYFDRMQEIWETALRNASDADSGALARDVYSILHYPMIVGIVFTAVALEESFLHPDERIEPVVGVLFVLGLGFYLLAMAVATYRCWRTYQYERVIGVAIIAAIVAFLDVSAQQTVLFSTIVLLSTMTAEYWRFREEIRGRA